MQWPFTIVVGVLLIAALASVVLSFVGSLLDIASALKLRDLLMRLGNPVRHCAGGPDWRLDLADNFHPS